LSASPRVVLGDDRRIQDSVALLRRADAVVTDYSGIFLEGLLIDVPAVFVPYDLEEYERGLPWDYAAYTPGPKVHTFAEFLQACGAALADRRTGAAERRRVREAFFAHPDGGATERVIDWLVQRLGGST
jgi:CDP-glycerol glycerophosphotransferase